MSAEQRELVGIIAALRADIEAAIAEGEGKKIKFDLSDAEVELKVAISEGKDQKVGGKFSFKVWGVGAELGGEQTEKQAQDYAHTVRLKLKPKMRNAEGKYKGIEISDVD